MKIKTLTAHGLKAGDFAHKLEAVNVIVGDNFKGKTSRLEAIRLGLMGYLPELGKTGAATFQLCGGTEMTVGCEFDNDSSITRDWVMQRGKVSTGQSFTGDRLEIPAVMMDPNEYFSLGDKDRMRYVFGLTKCEELEGKPVADVLISKVKSIKIEEHNESHEAAIRDLVQVIDDGDRARHDAEQPVQEWLESLVQDLRDRLKLAKGNADRMAKTVQGLTLIHATEDEGAIANVERQLTAARAELTELTAKRAVLVETIARVEKQQSERLVLSVFLQEHGDVTPQIKDHEEALRIINATLADRRIERNTLGLQVDAVAKADRRRTDLKARLAGKEDPSGRIATMEGELAGINSMLAVYQSDFEAAFEKQGQAVNDLKNAEAKAELLEQDLQERTAKHEQDMKAPKCPHCGAKAKGWKNHIEAEFNAWAKETNDRISILVDYIAGARVAYDDLTAKVQAARDADAKHQTNLQRSVKLAGELSTLRALRDTMGTVLGELKHLGPDTGEGQKLATEKAILDTHVNELSSHQTTLQETLATLRKQQSDWEQASAKLAGMGESTEDVDAMRIDQQQLAGKRADLTEQIQRLEDKQRKHVQAMQDAKRNAQSIQQHQGYVAEVQVTKESVSILEALQTELVKQAFGQILERANKVTAGILRSPLDYKDGEIGRWEGPTWISHKTFSGSEKALAYSGISVALAWESPIKIILLDELSRFDADHSSELLERFKELTERGFVDQVVCAGTHCDFVPEGVNVIRL